MRFHEILPAVMDGAKARRAAWTPWQGGWLELAHPSLPDGRPMDPALVIAYPPGGPAVRTWSRADWDITEDDWELLDGPCPTG